MDAATTPTKDERTLAMIAHLHGFVGYIFPFGNIIAPFVLWQMKKDQSAYITFHAKEALNFQITTTLLAILIFLLVFVLIGIPLLVALGIFDLVFILIAAVKANDGLEYRYPFTLRFVR